MPPSVPPPAAPVACCEAILEWHSRHCRRTSGRVSMRGLVEPCGSWQEEQPSVRMGACSKTNGPRLSEWHFRQPGSLAEANLRFALGAEPCGLWQSRQDMPLLPAEGSVDNGWACGFWKLASVFTWQEVHCWFTAAFRPWRANSFGLCTLWQLVQAMALRA